MRGGGFDLFGGGGGMDDGDDDYDARSITKNKPPVQKQAQTQKAVAKRL